MCSGHIGTWISHQDSLLPPQITWDTNPELLKAWKDGATGYPWIDAAMAQLRQWVSSPALLQDTACQFMLF